MPKSPSKETVFVRQHAGKPVKEVVELGQKAGLKLDDKKVENVRSYDGAQARLKAKKAGKPAAAPKAGKTAPKKPAPAPKSKAKTKAAPKKPSTPAAKKVAPRTSASTSDTERTFRRLVLEIGLRAAEAQLRALRAQIAALLAPRRPGCSCSGGPAKLAFVSHGSQQTAIDADLLNQWARLGWAGHPHLDVSPTTSPSTEHFIPRLELKEVREPAEPVKDSDKTETPPALAEAAPMWTPETWRAAVTSIMAPLDQVYNAGQLRTLIFEMGADNRTVRLCQQLAVAVFEERTTLNPNSWETYAPVFGESARDEVYYYLWTVGLADEAWALFNATGNRNAGLEYLRIPPSDVGSLALQDVPVEVMEAVHTRWAGIVAACLMLFLVYQGKPIPRKTSWFSSQLLDIAAKGRISEVYLFAGFGYVPKEVPPEVVPNFEELNQAHQQRLAYLWG